ncbi:hypothetical protein DFP72DRAFT_1069088 [Ephemerocybe angulata]|uniref:Uncharacterized protein n=1 Tax=Ephemerocybe angulata TaxID=980116 RepID=A0A8H6M792_9AGAR|nr:hypothetical protein DFP72DRAFT_1069088 [Tulosesus angulatus]
MNSPVPRSSDVMADVSVSLTTQIPKYTVTWVIGTSATGTSIESASYTISAPPWNPALGRSHDSGDPVTTITGRYVRDHGTIMKRQHYVQGTGEGANDDSEKKEISINELD